MKSDLALKYWDLANAVVAFSVLQMLAFLYSLASEGFREQVAKVYCLVIVAIAVSSFLSMVGVVGCYFAERKLRGEEPTISRLLLYTFLARVAIIGSFSLFGIAILVVYRHGFVPVTRVPIPHF